MGCSATLPRRPDVASTWPGGASPHLLDATTFWRDSGGVHRVVGAKRAVFCASGWRHTLLAPGAAGEGCIDSGGVTIPASGGYRFVVACDRAARAIERAAPDIVEAADPYVLAWSVLQACGRLGVPAVAFCHSNLPALMARLLGGEQTRRGRWAERRARAYLARLYERFDLVLAPSLHLQQQLLDAGVHRACLQPLGVDTAVFTPTARDLAWRSRLLYGLGLAPGTRLLVYHGRFAPEKELHLVERALRRLGPGYALVAIGAGPCPPRGPSVRVLPPEPDSARLARLIASCDVAVHAGLQETYGLAALEAMACGTPLVASAEAGLGELAAGGGIALHSRDPAAWAAAAHDAVSLRGSALTVRALRIARSRDWRVVFETLAARYRQAIRRSTRPAARGRVRAQP